MTKKNTKQSVEWLLNECTLRHIEPQLFFTTGHFESDHKAIANLAKHVNQAVVIGGDGFGYNFFNGEHLKVWHLSGVIIEDNVEIGANSTVDAGAFIPQRKILYFPIHKHTHPKNFF